MCAKCDEIDRKVERSRFLARQISDTIAVEGISKLVQELLAEKATLHPQPAE
jgi:hypothetical protein